MQQKETREKRMLPFFFFCMCTAHFAHYSACDGEENKARNRKAMQSYCDQIKPQGKRGEEVTEKED